MFSGCRHAEERRLLRAPSKFPKGQADRYPHRPDPAGLRPLGGEPRPQAQERFQAGKQRPACRGRHALGLKIQRLAYSVVLKMVDTKIGLSLFKKINRAHTHSTYLLNISI